MNDLTAPSRAIPAAVLHGSVPKPPLHLLVVLSGLMSLGSLSTDMYLPA